MNKFKFMLIAAGMLLSSLSIYTPAQAQELPASPRMISQTQTGTDQTTPATGESQDDIERQYHALVDQLIQNEQALVNATRTSTGKRTMAELNDLLIRVYDIETEYLASNKAGANGADLRAIAARYSDALVGLCKSREELRLIVVKPCTDLESTKTRLTTNPKFQKLLEADRKRLNPDDAEAIPYYEYLLVRSLICIYDLDPELDQYIGSNHLDRKTITRDQWLKAIAAAAPAYLERKARESAHPAPIQN